MRMCTPFCDRSLVATKSPAALGGGGVRSLSLFEVLVFSYYWHRTEDAANLPAIVGADGWARATRPLTALQP